MTNLDRINSHNFTNLLLDDSAIVAKGRPFKISDIELINPDFSEYEFYIHNIGFYYMHLLELCKQLEKAIPLLSNFRYDNRTNVTRVDHLTYNIENYIIRLTSILDRILQVINAVFHLCIEEKDINERVVINNLKVSRTILPNLYNNLRNSLSYYTGDRNTIVHRHSYLDKQLKRIQVFYNAGVSKTLIDNNDKSNQFKDARKGVLTRFLSDRKKEFNETNETCFNTILPILDVLEVHYKLNKKKLTEEI